MFNLVSALGGIGENKILQGKDFYVSYAPSTDCGEETALVKNIKSRNYFYILLGDYREEYEKVIPKGYTACKRLFNKLIKDGAEKSPWSN